MVEKGKKCKNDGKQTSQKKNNDDEGEKSSTISFSMWAHTRWGKDRVGEDPVRSRM